jgi:primosomal protein N' (replication factor Y)
MASSGSERTADELGRVSNTRVILADGDHPVISVDARPALVVATRGAEPHADGGYRRHPPRRRSMLLAEQLRIGESACAGGRTPPLAAPGHPCISWGDGAVARALATWTQPAYARAELVDRAAVHMPPTVRVASVEGSRRRRVALTALREAVPALDARRSSGRCRSRPVGVRALVRFDYARPRVAESLRASVVADALRGRRALERRPLAARTTLRVRLDVPELDL